MFTLCIHYTLNPNLLRHFRSYLESELPVIRRNGGNVVGYFLPTDFAGPTNEAYGLIEFSDLASYERYRDALAHDADHRRNVEELERSGAVAAMKRSFIERVRVGEAD